MDILKEVFSGEDLREWGFSDEEIVVGNIEEHKKEDVAEPEEDNVKPEAGQEYNEAEMEVMVMCPKCGREFYASEQS